MYNQRLDLVFFNLGLRVDAEFSVTLSFGLNIFTPIVHAVLDFCIGGISGYWLYLLALALQIIQYVNHIMNAGLAKANEYVLKAAASTMQIIQDLRNLQERNMDASNALFKFVWKGLAVVWR